MDAHLLGRTFAWLTAPLRAGLERALSGYGRPFPLVPRNPRGSPAGRNVAAVGAHGGARAAGSAGTPGGDGGQKRRPVLPDQAQGTPSHRRPRTPFRSPLFICNHLRAEDCR
jgi:hypothetical protein